MYRKGSAVNRRHFLKGTAAAGLGAATTAAAQVRFDHTADVVIVGAGASGLPAAIMARDHGASVVVIDANHDIGGHAMLSGGRIPLGGGTSLQKKYGVADSADQVYLDHTNHRNPEFRYADRELVRAWADENVASFEFLLDNGVIFQDVAPTIVNGGTVPGLFVTKVYSDNFNETINGSPGSGLVRHLEASARKKGATILLRHKLTRIIRENPTSGRVIGITAQFDGKDVNIRAKNGVILATGGHTSNVEFRRRFDPRLTEEYQTTGEPWTKQNADGEILALAMGATLWSTANQANPRGFEITKTIHIGCRYGYRNLKWNPQSPLFKLAGASGLSVRDFQNLILINQIGQRFWNEVDETYEFLGACLGTNGALGKNGSKANGGGPIWAIFDADAVQREHWDPQPPNVDLNGWFFSARHAGRTSGQDQEPVPVPTGAWRRPRSDGSPLQFPCRCRQGPGLRQAHAEIQNPDAAFLRGLVNAHSARHTHGDQDQYQVPGDRRTRKSNCGTVLRGRIGGRVRLTRSAESDRVRPHRRPGSRPR